MAQCSSRVWEAEGLSGVYLGVNCHISIHCLAGSCVVVSPPSILSRLGERAFFLHPSETELGRLLPRYERLLPMPQPIYLEGEMPTAMRGMMVVESAELSDLDRTLEDALEVEALAQLALHRRKSFDVDRHKLVWKSYMDLLSRACQSIASSAYGRDFPAVFWLFHSSRVATLIQGMPRRVLREWSEIRREEAAKIKYQTLQKYLQRAHRIVCLESGSPEAPLEEAPGGILLSLMTRNILIFSEERVGRELDELQSYFEGHLEEDGTRFRYHWARLREWLQHKLAHQSEFAELARLVLRKGEEPSADRMLTTIGFVKYLSSRPDYDPEELLSEPLVTRWESLLEQLKLFELLDQTRRMVAQVSWQEGRLVCDAQQARRLGGERKALFLSQGGRPLDFMSPWVVNPAVMRYGLMYDLSDFTRLLAEGSRQGSSGSGEATFRALVTLQRRFDRVAHRRNLGLEKYLGDGAFYTGRNARQLCFAALEMQRAYREAVAEGFPINSGIRLALNYGEYRLLPLLTSGDNSEERYELFGRSVAELSRLTSGKANRDLDEIRLELISRGYEEAELDRILAPLLTDADRDPTSRAEGPRLSARLTPSGQLQNEGITTTAEFLVCLESLPECSELSLLELADRSFVVACLDDGPTVMAVGIRRLGRANLKGLDQLTVFEVVDADRFADRPRTPLEGSSFIDAIDRLFTAVLAH